MPERFKGLPEGRRSGDTLEEPVLRTVRYEQVEAILDEEPRDLYGDAFTEQRIRVTKAFIETWKNAKDSGTDEQLEREAQTIWWRWVHGHYGPPKSDAIEREPVRVTFDTSMHKDAHGEWLIDDDEPGAVETTP